MITAVVVAAITGMAVGWVLALTTASAAMSHSQQRMQQKVRYWQAEAALARAQAQAERLARKAITQEDAPPGI
jgi:type II secretory pathway component PulJ